MFDQHYKKESPTFTGITRGVGGFGFGASSAGGGGGGSKNINLLINGKFGSAGNYTGADVATYWANAVENNYSGQKTNEFVQTDFTRVGDGILKFTLSAGTYKIYARSGDGSGNNHWTGHSVECNLTLTSDHGMLLLVPNHGMGSYAAGGGLFLISGTDYTDSTTNRAILILGGGGGGYIYYNTFGQSGILYNLLSSRKGPSSGTGGTYDGGAGWLNSYNVKPYGGIGGSYYAQRARHFVEGGSGGYGNACSNPGGFGGGGGSCPAGAGGHLGGYPGTDGHNGGQGYGGSGNGANTGGGGGTSYYNTSYAPAVISNITNANQGSISSTNHSSETASAQGYFGIYTV